MKEKGGNKVGKGTYWNFTTGERIDISHEGVLPGNSRTVYFRMPATGIIILGPVLGLLYAAFLPFIGIAMLVKVVMQKVAGGVFSSAQTTASFGWRPSESYLSGKKNVKGETEKKEEGEKDAPDKHK